MVTILIDVAIAGGSALIGCVTGMAITAPKVAQLTDKLETGAARMAELTRLNRDLNKEVVSHRIRASREKARRSAAVAKGNRTRSAKFHAARAAKVAELAEGK